MKYKLLATDVDGTLLDSKNQITDVTADAINRMIAKGYYFVISTGRPVQAVKPFFEKINIKDMPFILYNGSMVMLDSQVIFSKTLEKDIAIDIIRESRNKDVSVVAWADNNLLCEEKDEKIEKYKKLSGVEPVVLNNLEDAAEIGITKILWYGKVDEIVFFQKILNKKYEGKVNCHTSNPMFLEFVSIECSKALALQRIGEKLNINKNEMIAVGDGCNDLSMIEYSGLGIAMSNAPQEVKERAKIIAPSNNENGVAWIINKYFI